MFTVAATTKPFEPVTPADLNSFEGITDRVAARGLAPRDEDDDILITEDDEDDILSNVRGLQLTR